MSDQKKISAFIIRNFNDKGTGQAFAANKIEPISEGSFLNYKAAGLVRAATADDKKAADAAGKLAA